MGTKHHWLILSALCIIVLSAIPGVFVVLLLFVSLKFLLGVVNLDRIMLF